MGLLGWVVGLALAAGLPGAAASGSPASAAGSPLAASDSPDSAKSRPAPVTSHPGAAARGPGFAAHLRDAIALNKARREYYAAATGGASKDLSNRLIAQERMALLVAGSFDARARDFEAAGIPVVSGSFVPMALAPEASASFPAAGTADPATLSEARSILSDLSAAVPAALKRDDFKTVAESCAGALDRLEALEKRSGSLFAMGRHIVESLGHGAVTALACAKQSGGATVPLSRDLVGIQTLALGGAIDTDALAQPFHAKGVGILVNDLPPIPFRDRWQALHPAGASQDSP